MRKLGKSVLAAALVASLAAGQAMAADDDGADSTGSDSPPPPKQSSFRWSPAFARMFQLDQQKPPLRKPNPPRKDTDKRPAPARPTTLAVDPTVAERSKAETVLMRRLEVCDKLKEIALRSNDSQLFHRAELLDERARLAYAQQTGTLSSVAGRFESDEKTLDRHLSMAGKPTDRLTSTATATAALGNAGNGPAAIKEVSR
jgi:hypothetical protein